MAYSFQIPDYSLPVNVVHRGEFAMSAYLFEIYPPFPIQGIHQFDITNGFAYYSDETSSIIIGDSSMIISIQIFTREVVHLCRTNKNWFFASGQGETGCGVFIPLPYRRLEDGGRGIKCYIPWNMLPVQEGFGPIVRDGSRAILPSAPGYNAAFAESPLPEILSTTEADPLFEQTVLGQAAIQICKDVAIQAATCCEVLKLPEYSVSDLDEWMFEISQSNLALVCKLLFKRSRKICSYLKVSEPVGVEMPSSDNRALIDFLGKLNNELERLMQNRK